MMQHWHHCIEWNRWRRENYGEPVSHVLLYRRWLQRGWVLRRILSHLSSP